MSDWSKGSSGEYARSGYKISGIVIQDGEVWQSEVRVDGRVIYLAEWDGRSDAIGNANGAMSRACWLRRFDKDPPLIPDDGDDEEEDDEE